MAIASQNWPIRPGEDTRRALLAKAGALGGGVGLIALSRTERAGAAHNLPVPSPAPGSGDLAVSNVKDWGAIGDGVHNDQPNIQDCLNDSAGNARVYLPPGIYRLATFVAGSTLLDIPSNTFLFGDGQFSVLKADYATATVATVMNTTDGVSPSNIRIEDLVVDCNSNVNGFAIKIVGTSSARNCFLRRLEVKNLTLATPDFDSPSWALNLRRWVDGAVEDCHVHHTQRDGINLQDSKGNVVISGNVLEDCGDDHIVANGMDDGGVTVIGNVVNANTTTRGGGIVSWGRRVTITGNVVFGAVRGGIELRPGAEDVVVSGNVVIETGNTSGTARSESPAWGPIEGSGISVLMGGSEVGDIRRVTIADNVITKPRSNGIMFASGKAAYTISNVSVSGNVVVMDEPTVPFPNSGLPRRGIALRWFDSLDPVGPIRGVQIKDNQVLNAKSEGIYAKGTQILRLDIHQNTVVDSGTDESPSVAIKIANIGSASIVGNRAYDTAGVQDNGLDVQDCTGTLIIVGNDFVENGTGNFPILYQANTSGPSELRIRDNPGFNPWVGQVTTPVGAWTSFQPYAGGPTYYRKDVVVTFGVPFPAGTTPKMLSIPRAEGYCVAVITGANPHVSQTLRVWVPENINPNTTVLLNWMAEPVD